MTTTGILKRRWLVAGAAVAILAIGVYLPTIGHGFVYDDGPEVIDNNFIRSLGSLPRVFESGAWMGARDPAPIYRPLTTATYALNFLAGGLDPTGYHLVNVLLHAVASALLLLLGASMGLPLPAAAMAAALFAVHPVHVEAVANVAGRKDLLATLFLLLAVAAHARERRSGGWSGLIAVLSFSAATFSKEIGLVGLGLFVAWDLLLGDGAWRRNPRRTALLYAGYGVAAVGYLVARWATIGTLVFPDINFSENPIASAPALVRVATAIATVGRGLALLVLPIRLSPDYSFRAIQPVGSLLDPAVLATLAAVGVLVLLTLRAGARRAIFGFLILWYAMGLFPGSNLLFPVGTIFGERLLYLPSAAACLAAGIVADGWARGRARAPVLGAVGALVLALTAQTVSYSHAWADEMTLFATGVQAKPESAKLREMLGAVLMQAGKPAEAVQQFEEGLRLLEGSPAPTSWLRLERAYAIESLGRLGEAGRAYEDLLRENPGFSDALWRLGNVRWAEGRKAEAQQLWHRTIAANPRHARAMSDLGIAYELAGDDARAKEMWLRATVDPSLATVWFRLGDLYEREGDLARARDAWTQFLERENGRIPAARSAAIDRLRRTAPPRR